MRLATTTDVEAVARRLAEDFRDALEIEVDLTVIADEELVPAQRALVEKNLPLPFDVLVHAWFDLAAGYPRRSSTASTSTPAARSGPGPVVPEFEDLMARSVVETDANRLGELGKEIDKLVYDEAMNVFLCCPQALVAVNDHVDFTGHAATLELAETEVTEEHWSRRTDA